MGDRCEVQGDVQAQGDRQDAAALAMLEESMGLPPRKAESTAPKPKGKCDDQIDAQTNREINKITPKADNATLQSMYNGITLSEREEAKREMKEALDRKLNELPKPVELKQEDLAKHHIKVEGNTMTFPNGVKYDTSKMAVDTGDPGKAGGIFMTKSGPFGTEYYSDHKTMVATMDTVNHKVHIAASNGEYIVDQATGKVTYQQAKLNCGGLPQLTLEQAKKENAEARKKREAEDLARPWDQ